MNTDPNGTNGRRPRIGGKNSSEKLGDRNRLDRLNQKGSRSGKPSRTISVDSDSVSHVDFHALGLSPNECRLTIIRRAAARNCSTLAERQLNSPSSQNELQLRRVAMSAYRLMDPRKRTDPGQRAYVGRVLPIAMMSAGRTRFAVGPSNDTATPERSMAASIASHFFGSAKPSANATDESDEFSYLDLDDSLPFLAHGMELENDFAKTLDSDDLLNRGPLRRAYSRLLATPKKTLVASATAAAVALSLIATYQYLTSPSVLIETSDNQSQALIASAPSSSQASGQQRTVEPFEAAVAPAPTGEAIVAQALTEPIAGRSPLDADGDDRVPSEMDDLTIAQSLDLWNSPSPQNESTDDAMPVDIVAPVEPLDIAILESAMPMIDEPTMASTANEPSIAEPNTESRGSSEPDLRVATKDHSADFDRDVEPVDFPNYLPDPFADLASATLVTPDPVFRPRDSAPSELITNEFNQRLNRLVPPLQKPVDAASIDVIVASLGDFETFHCLDADASWVSRQRAAQALWLNQDVEDIQRILAPLSELFVTDTDDLLVDSFVEQMLFREETETHLHRIEQGIRLYDYLLVSEQFDLANKIDRALGRSVDFVDDPSHAETLRQFREASEQMVRLKTNAKAIIDQTATNPPTLDLEKPQTRASDHDSQEFTASQANIAGRYLCLMQRQWRSGLQWMARGNDARLAPLAKQELLLNPTSSASDRMDVAQRWLAASQRGAGREHESMHLHSLELFRSALLTADAIEKSEIERTIADLEFKLPWYLAFPVKVSMVETIGEPVQQNPVQQKPDETQQDIDDPVDEVSISVPNFRGKDLPASTDDAADEPSTPDASSPSIRAEPADSAAPEPSDAAEFQYRSGISKQQPNKRNSVLANPHRVLYPKVDAPLLGQNRMRLPHQF